MLGIFEQVCSLISETLCLLLSIHYSFHLCTNSLLYLMVLICQLPIQNLIIQTQDMPYQIVLYPFTSEISVYASAVQVCTCLASFALSRAIVAVSSARAAAMLLLAHLVFRALISLPSVSRWRMATFRSLSLFEVSDSIWKIKESGKEFGIIMEKV